MMLGKETHKLLLPVNPLFLYGSLLVALLLNFLPLGRVTWIPDFLLLTLLFWCLHQPQYVGVLTAFICGLLMDVHQTTPLGMHGLAYSVAAYLAFLLHRRIRLFHPYWQALQVAAVLLATHALLWLLRLATGGHWPGVSLLLAPLLETVLWPVWSVLLLAPQRRAPDPDATRPL